MSLSVKEIIGLAEKQLADSGVENAGGDAKSLYCYMTAITESKMILEYQNVLQDLLCDRYFELIDRRSSGEPLQYIVGNVSFMGYKFNVTPDVLIPRQDTESVVESALAAIKASGAEKGDILDLCCGSGAIGISLAGLLPGSSVTCSDISEKALAVARSNAELNEVNKKVSFSQGDMFAPFTGKFKKRKFDCIVSNPPYIPSDKVLTLQREITEHEPLSALDGGEDGLDFYRCIAEHATEHLRKKAVLVLEIGDDQADEVGRLLAGKGFENINVHRDLAGRNRCVTGRLPAR